MRSFAIAATVVASASMAVAQSATVNNNCDFPVYLWAVADEASPCHTLAAGETWSETYQTRESGGCSVKISEKDDLSGPVTQFEYTYTPDSIFGGIFYDISNINGQPFQDVLTQLIPQNAGAVTNTSACSTVNCPAGQTECSMAYNVWDDNYATHSCPLGTDLVFNVCSPGSGNSGNSGSSSQAAPPSSSPAPQQYTPKPTPTPAPKSTPAPSPSPVQQKTSEAPVVVATADVKAVASPAPAKAPASGYALEWTGSGPVRLGEISKREAHANHMERHNRIRRMHHARSTA